MPLATWLLALVSPLIARILIALGFSVVSIVGMDLVIGQLKDMVKSNINALPSDLINLFLFAGGGVALGIIFGAIATKLLIWQIQNAVKIIGAN